MNTENLLTSLMVLYKVALSKCKKYIKEDKLLSLPYEMIPVVNYRYDFDHILYDLDYPKITFYQKYEWELATISDLVDKELPTAKEYQNCVNEIVNTFGFPKTMTELSTLKSFLRPIVQQAPNGISGKAVRDFAQDFINDLKRYKDNGLLMKWSVSVAFDGLYLSDEQYKISDVMRIRRLKAEEFQTNRRKSSHISEDQMFFSHSSKTGALLEFSMESTTNKNDVPEDVEAKISTISDCLLLFKRSDIYPVRRSCKPKAVLTHGFSKRINIPFDQYSSEKVNHQDYRHFPYQISKKDVPLLRKFIITMDPILSKLQGESYFGGKEHELAYHRYKDTMLRSPVNVIRLSSAMSCLEAMLGEQGSELTTKIALRCTVLLQVFGFKNLEVRDDIKKAYDIRSKLVHGDKISPDKIKFSRERTHIILDYVRIILIIFLQLKDVIKKPELIKLVDDAMVDNAQLNTLKGLIRKNTLVPFGSVVKSNKS